jgi:hypothetical protein
MSTGGIHGGVEHAAEPPALQEQKTSQDLNVAPSASGDQVNCVQVAYGRCSPVGITDLLVKRAKQVPPGVRLALLSIWRTILAGLGAKPQHFEPMWVEAGLDPQAIITPEDRVRAEIVAEETLEPCRLCVMDLATFFKRVVRRVVLASKPNGSLLLVLELEHNGNDAIVVTKLSDWVKKEKEGVTYIIPLNFQENLRRRLGIELEAHPYDLYLELTRIAEHYDTVADAYVKPMLMQVVERLRATPHLAKCTKDGRVIYIASELFRTVVWYFDANIGLGRNKFFEALRRYKLVAAPHSVPVDMHDEYGMKVKKRALAFLIDRLSEFIEFDISSICRAAAGLGDEAVEGGEEQPTPLSGGYA